MPANVLGVMIGASFGLVYVLINAGTLPPAASTPLRIAAVAAFVAVIVASHRRRHAPPPDVPPIAFTRSYRLIVLAELVAAVAGIVVLNALDQPLAVLPWVTLVVGLHFVALAATWRQPSLRVLGAGLTICGAVGLVLALAGADQSVSATVAGTVPGALLLAGSWWAATRPPVVDASRA